MSEPAAPPRPGTAPPALRYERWPIAALRQDPGNARRHPRQNVDAIKASLTRWGQVLPVLVRGGQVVAGNATTVAAAELGWAHLDVVVADHLSEEEVRPLAVALNRIPELAEWDRPVLLEVLQEHPDALEAVGFTVEQLAELEALANPEPFDPYAEWEAMPDFESRNLQSVFHTVVHFRSQDDADRFFALIGQPKRTSTWWPEPDGHKGADTRAAYVALDPDGASGAAQP